MASKNPASRRAALRQQQEADEKAKRAKRVLIASIGIAVVVLVTVVGIVLAQMMGRGQTGEQITPAHASDTFGIYVGGKAPVDGTPHVIIWGDYMCGGCAAFDQMYGPVIDELVASGDITAEVRQAHFRDGQMTKGPSKRAAIAAAAAAEVDFFDAYHRTLYANQETAYTDQVLRELIPASIGLEGADLTRFQDLFDTSATEKWVEGAHQLFTDSGVQSTPSYFVGDQPLMVYDYDNDKVLVEPDAAAFLAAVRALNGS